MKGKGGLRWAHMGQKPNTTEVSNIGIKRSKLTPKRHTKVHLWGLTYIHTCRPTSTRRVIFHELCGDYSRSSHPEHYFPPAGRFWASGAEKFPTMGDPLLRTPMNPRAKFDTLAREIRHRTAHKITDKQ